MLRRVEISTYHHILYKEARTTIRRFIEENSSMAYSPLGITVPYQGTIYATIERLTVSRKSLPLNTISTRECRFPSFIKSSQLIATFCLRSSKERFLSGYIYLTTGRILLYSPAQLTSYSFLKPRVLIIKAPDKVSTLNPRGNQKGPIFTHGPAS